MLRADGCARTRRLLASAAVRRSLLALRDERFCILTSKCSKGGGYRNALLIAPAPHRWRQQQPFQTQSLRSQAVPTATSGRCVTNTTLYPMFPHYADARLAFASHTASMAESE
jgi:hypothetical protein